MKITTGIDIIEVERIREGIENLKENFLHRIYTEKEIEYCEKFKNMKYQHYAARFAVKEAVYKAISQYVEYNEDSLWLNIEVMNDNSGKPVLNVDKLNTIISKTADNLMLRDIDISISHIKDYAVASVVAMFDI